MGPTPAVAMDMPKPGSPRGEGELASASTEAQAHAQPHLCPGFVLPTLPLPAAVPCTRHTGYVVMMEL